VNEKTTLTGYKRPKVTRRNVALADAAAQRIITAGGVMVIAAVMGILAYLVIQVIPLFADGRVTEMVSSSRLAPWARSSAAMMDEYRQLALEISPNGKVMVYHPASGEIVSESTIESAGMAPATIAIDRLSGGLAAGFVDGSIAIGQATFHSDVLPAGFDVSQMRQVGPEEWVSGDALFSRITGGQTRKVWAEAKVENILLPPGGDAAVAMALSLSGSEGSRSQAVATLDSAGGFWLHIARTKKNMMTGQIKATVRSYSLPRPSDSLTNPSILVTENGADTLLVEEDGTLFRYNTREPSAAFLAETIRLTAPGVGISSIGFLAGRQSLVVGGSDGGVGIHFILPKEGARAKDGLRTVKTARLDPHDGPVTAIVPSAGGKSFLTVGPDGIWIRNGSGQRTLLRLDLDGQSPSSIRAIALAPNLDGALLAGQKGSVRMWRFNAPYPQASWRAYFGRMWYEGYPKPSYTWQSSAATDDFEPKLSLIPLIFGTLKASFYSMLFAAPVALLAAVFTAEFLDKRFRGPLKTVMEMMASLPSVALGFVAALVVAPVAERWIGAIMLGGLLVPLFLIVGAYMWQLLPRPMADRFSGGYKVMAIALTLLAGGGTAAALGGAFENLFFGGDFKLWLSGTHGDGTPFLIILFFPLSAALVALATERLGRGRGAGSGAMELARAAMVVVSAAVISLAMALVAQRLGLDPRNGLVGPYVQRNTLIVGFAMGFAVIPIIYTIAEDSLSAVPDHLRAASLGCGATVWQTAAWVVIPTAASGIFSAIMIGMGRAVGETMIVVMAAGNTPLMDINVFTGLRALSANIAVELPEAEVGGALYRTLFLSGLVLFLMTFAINSVAEIVRLRFRRRFANL